jgi:hypothetical protein
MRRFLPWLTLLALAFPLTGSKLGKLSEAEQIEYRVFRAFMTEDDQKAWLKLQTTEERTTWLKEHKLWEKFYTESPEVQGQIVSGKVGLGWTRDQVYLAWGAPFQKQRLTGREAARSELLVYRFEVDKEGYASPLVGKKENYQAVSHYQVELVMDDDMVAELDKKDRWE